MMNVLRRIPLPGCRHRFTLCGLNLERFLNLLHTQEIPLLYARRTGPRKLVCECRSADLGRILDLAEEKGWRTEDVRPLGLTAALERLKKRPGIPIGILLAAVASLVLSQYVWRVDINGAGSYHAEMTSFLSESGYVPGIKRNSVDADALERELTYRYPQIAWFHVYVSGVRIVVDVTPGVAMPQLPQAEPGDVVASRAGIVQSVQVFSGTAKVKAGDVVRKGQVLIQGLERAADEQLVPVRAQGAVMARCWETHTVSVPLYDIVSEETGQETQQLCIWTPLFSFPQELESPDYLAFNTYVEELPLGGCFVPVVCQRFRRREVSMQYVPRSMDEVRQEAAQAALKHLKTKHFGDEIIDKWVDYCMIESESLAAAATVEWLMDIGEPSSP